MEASRILGALRATRHDLKRRCCTAFTLGGLLRDSPLVALLRRAELRLHASEVRFGTVRACCRRTATQVRRGVRARNARTCVLP